MSFLQKQKSKSQQPIHSKKDYLKLKIPMRYKLISEEEIKLLEENNLLESLTENELSQYTFSKGFFSIDFFSTYFLYEWKTLEDGTFIETPFFHKDIWKILTTSPVIDFVVIIAR